MLIAFTLLAAAQAAPLIELRCADKPDCETGATPIANTLSPADQEAAIDIYRPYWECHWQRVRRHENFGSASRDVAVAVFRSAVSGCAEQRAAAIARVDQLLRKPMYGDEVNRRKLREQLLLEGGSVFMFLASGQTGEREKITPMVEALAGGER